MNALIGSFSPNNSEKELTNMKTSKKKKISWSERIDLSANLLLVIVACLVMAVLAFLAIKVI